MGQLTFQATLGGAVNLTGPNTASTTTFTLPAADGTNGQFLQTNGTGGLSFATPTVTYPSSGIANSTGSGWGTSYSTTGSGTVVALATNPTITNYTESVVSIGNTGTAQTLSLTSGTVLTATLTGNCTFTMPTASAGKSFVLLLKTGAGSFTGTFTGVKWNSVGAPTITATASKMDILTFVADGTNWYGSYSQGYTP